MEKATNKYISVAYKLYCNDNGERSIVEEAPAERPFQFISGLGIALDEFEKAVVGLAQGETFELTLSKDQAYGDYEQERVLDLDKEMFCIDGKLDEERVYVGSIIPLQNAEGQRFPGKVLEIGDAKVRIDLNHPLAGKELHFEGTVIESREATNAEIQQIINRLSGEGCGCGGNCGGGCNHGGGDCGCGNCH